jgi:hypothetical protein
MKVKDCSDARKERSTFFSFSLSSNANTFFIFSQKRVACYSFQTAMMAVPSVARHYVEKKWHGRRKLATVI